jgi:hypothetical protein
MPGVLAGAALVAAVFLWTRNSAGRGAAWVAAFLICFDPTGIFLAQLDRFYALHALFFFLGAVGVYSAATPGTDRSRIGTAARVFLGVGALAVALALHLTTVIGIAGILVWLVLARGQGLVRSLGSHRRLLVGAAVALVATIILIVGSGLTVQMWESYTWADDWAVRRSQNFLFYHTSLLSRYATLWSLFPVIVIVALSAAPRVAGFCAVLFATSLLGLTFGAMKSERYVFFVLPFFFVLGGIAVSEAIPWLRGHVLSILGRWRALVQRPRAAATAAGAALAGILIFVLGSNRAPVLTVRMLTVQDGDASVYGWQPNWIEAAAALRPLADSSTVVLSSWPLASLYYLDRVDISLHASELTTDAGRLPEFAVPNWYLARHTISEPASLTRLLACEPSGLVIVEGSHWRNPWQVNDDMANQMVAQLELVPVPERWGLLVFRWRAADLEQGDRPDCGHLGVEAISPAGSRE